ncbi:hypothetical protein DDZ14_04625 [Maritimibacter sp. 55A14]|uniref:phage holin family protein n=1 Tax=Maritimibacter sp. 55A14 TaxID=2174844 RepID=UPI000D6137F7|nr:phage holin family protein [Maritimibacter sp. 55A14]PWE33487.1 hypothetical protein DDZ14_04625 [Maritimibacter sp. 55A14]
MVALIERTRQRARLAARMAAFSVLGVVLVGVGCCFFTLAAWLLLAAMEGPLFAATVIGAVFLAAGCIFLAVAAGQGSAASASDPRTQAQETADRPRRTSAGAHPLTLLAEGFVLGLEAGRSAGGGGGRRRE